MEMTVSESDRSPSRDSFATTENEEHMLIGNLMEGASMSRPSSAQGSLAHEEDEERNHVLSNENATMETLPADFDTQSLGEESLPKVRPRHNIRMACKYCVLCQAQFPPFFSEISGIDTFWKWRQKRKVQPWEYKFRAVIEINREDEEEDIGITELMAFPEGRCQEGTFSLIWGYVGPSSAYGSFMIVADETSRLFYQMHRPAQLSVALYPKSSLVPKMIRIFGTDYIQSLCAESTTIPITDAAIACSYKLAIGTHGICAIQIVSEDGSFCWVGKVPTSGLVWYVDAQRDFRRDVKLYYTFKGLNIDGESFLNYIHRDGYGLYRYIPFYKGYEYTTGITFHFHTGLITVVEAYYGENTELTGVYSGVALHLPLEHNERISFVWIKLVDTRSPRYYIPAFVIQTTHGRTCHLGPYIPPDDYQFYDWYRLTFQGQITGICVQNSDWALKNFNITSDGNEVEPLQPLLHYETPRQQPQKYQFNNFGLYFSSGKFFQMKKVTSCRINERCVGILIHYLYKPPLVLGQWYKPEVSIHQIIYDRSHPPPSRIMFRSARFGKSEEEFVVDVNFTQEETPSVDTNDHVQVFDLGLEEHIAWWFTTSTDLISLWNPGDQPANGIQMSEVICRDYEK
ncbi:uncharacterized protein EAE97_001786 [Botrytis byssoidea]|uniref:Uncharacterized protein n=1 Tax=Botrytis byssoidea TaxID=139641 RepID=A0A9P5IUX7_9HELO|nr:uncharacterized protein EAE97_001786 [Botrytis byssoidea]KAF7952289.1 hypothetical protein EAE97_001786 [Botrytis byssoidea]